MPRMIELIRASAVPSNLVQAAAKGALAVPAGEMIEILVHLAVHNSVFSDRARLTLASWDEALSVAAAANRETATEVLEYLVAPKNLRPALLPALLENPSVPEKSLVELAQSGTRQVVDAMLKSPRVSFSEVVREALRSNPNLTGIEAEILSERAAPASRPNAEQNSASAPTPVDEIVLEAAEPGEDHVLEEEVNAFLTAHAVEITAEGNKPFQAIGGVFDELDLEEAPAVAVASPASAVTATGAAAAKQAAVAKKTFLSAEESRGSALQKISKLGVKGRIQLAIKGSKEERSILVRDGTKIVALAVLDSPKISDGEAEKFAGQKNVLEAVLRAIPMKRRFVKNYLVLRALVFNPRTPLDVSLGLMKNILPHDLRNLASNKDVSDTIRKLALKMFKQKTDASKKHD